MVRYHGNYQLYRPCCGPFRCSWSDTTVTNHYTALIVGRAAARGEMPRELPIIPPLLWARLLLVVRYHSNYQSFHRYCAVFPQEDCLSWVLRSDGIPFLLIYTEFCSLLRVHGTPRCRNNFHRRPYLLALSECRLGWATAHLRRG